MATSQATQKSQAVLDDLVTNKKVPGVIAAVVDKSGELLFHSSAGVRDLDTKVPMHKDDFCWIASCTKLITAIAALQLVEQGKVKLDDTVEKHLPELAQAKILESADGSEFKLSSAPAPAPTLRQLLTHTAGHSYEFFNPATCKWFEAQKIASFSCTRASISAPLQRAPGGEWEYGTSIDWAGQLVERVSGQSLDAYFKQHIFEPLRIKNITFLPKSGGLMSKLANLHQQEPDGTVKVRGHIMQQNESKIEVQYGGAGLYANAAEYVQVLCALVNDGTHPKGGRILSPASVDELFKGQLNDAQRESLKKRIPNPMPWMSHPVDMAGPDNWAIGGLKSKGLGNGLSETDSVWWAGIANHYWFADRERGRAGMIQAQIFPFGNPDIIGGFFFGIAPAWLTEAK